jgi:hypothetical protein
MFNRLHGDIFQKLQDLCCENYDHTNIIIPALKEDPFPSNIICIGLEAVNIILCGSERKCVTAYRFVHRELWRRNHAIVETLPPLHNAIASALIKFLCRRHASALVTTCMSRGTGRKMWLNETLTAVWLHRTPHPVWRRVVRGDEKGTQCLGV